MKVWPLDRANEEPCAHFLQVPVHIISSVSIPITIYTHSPNPLFAAAQAPTKRYAEAGMMAKQYIDVATQCPPLLSITDMPVRQSGILKMIAPRKSLMTSLGLCRPMNPPTQPSVQLSEEQKSVLDDVMEGTSLFFTGPAGEFLTIHCHHFRENEHIFITRKRYRKVCIIAGNYSQVASGF